MRAAGRMPGRPGEWNKVHKEQKSTWANCCISSSPHKPLVPNLCHWQFNACHIESYFIHSTPCRINLHPSILSSCLSHVKQHVLLRPITSPTNWALRIDGISCLRSCEVALSFKTHFIFWKTTYSLHACNTHSPHACREGESPSASTSQYGWESAEATCFWSRIVTGEWRGQIVLYFTRMQGPNRGPGLYMCSL
jgi:hypothetical protein